MEIPGMDNAIVRDMKVPARVALQVNAYLERYEMLIYACHVGDEWHRMTSQMLSFLLLSNVFALCNRELEHKASIYFPVEELVGLILNNMKGILFPTWRCNTAAYLMRLKSCYSKYS